MTIHRPSTRHRRESQALRRSSRRRAGRGGARRCRRRHRSTSPSPPTPSSTARPFPAAGTHRQCRARPGLAYRQSRGHVERLDACVERADRSERINCADTVKVQWSAALRKGRVIFTDMGRVPGPSSKTPGRARPLVGGSTAASNLAAYGRESAKHARQLHRRSGQARTRSARYSSVCHVLRAGRRRGRRRFRVGRGKASCRRLRRFARRAEPRRRVVELSSSARSGGAVRTGPRRGHPLPRRAAAAATTLPYRQHRGEARLRIDRSPLSRMNIAMDTSAAGPTRSSRPSILRAPSTITWSPHAHRGRMWFDAARRCASSTPKASRRSTRCSTTPHDFAERYSSQDTLRVQRSAYLSLGAELVSTEGRVMARIVADTCGDTIRRRAAARARAMPCASAKPTKYQHACRENFIVELGRARHEQAGHRVERQPVHERSDRSDRATSPCSTAFRSPAATWTSVRKWISCACCRTARR